MTRARLTLDDAMTMWRARDLYRVHSLLSGCLRGFFLAEFCLLASRGHWAHGLLLIVVQWACLWALGWALRWLGRRAHHALWWGIDHGQYAVHTWRRAPRR
jgi:hypothetical protein